MAAGWGSLSSSNLHRCLAVAIFSQAPHPRCKTLSSPAVAWNRFWIISQRLLLDMYSFADACNTCDESQAGELRRFALKPCALGADRGLAICIFRADAKTAASLLLSAAQKGRGAAVEALAPRSWPWWRKAGEAQKGHLMPWTAGAQAPSMLQLPWILGSTWL